MNYPAVLSQEGTDIVIAFPDCPGCQTFARAGDNALHIAQEALTGWLEAGLEHGRAPPRPSGEIRVSGNVQVLVVPVPDDLAEALEARWRWA